MLNVYPSINTVGFSRYYKSNALKWSWFGLNKKEVQKDRFITNDGNETVLL